MLLMCHVGLLARAARLAIAAALLRAMRSLTTELLAALPVPLWQSTPEERRPETRRLDWPSEVLAIHKLLVTVVLSFTLLDEEPWMTGASQVKKLELLAAKLCVSCFARLGGG